MKRTIFVTALILTLVPLAAPSPANEIVEIRLRSFVFPAPATFSVTVAVEPAAVNRKLVVEADSDNYFRSSTITLEGADEKRLHSIEFKSVPAGNYVLSARVLSTSDVLGVAREGLVVTGVGGER